MEKNETTVESYNMGCGLQRKPNSILYSKLLKYKYTIFIKINMVYFIKCNTTVTLKVEKIFINLYNIYE